ncbi:ComF family protein [Chloroflexota bacterium]
MCHSCIASFKPPDATIQDTANLTAITALGEYSDVLQNAIQALKYEHNTALAQPLGQLLASQIQSLQWPPGIIMPVPLHSERLRQRGYNQAALLAQAMARQLNWPYDDKLLNRVRATTSQVGLDFQARQHNVKQAFGVTTPMSVQTSNVILVDDVYTTGATIRECAAALVEAGNTTVRACVVGRAKFSKPDC